MCRKPTAKNKACTIGSECASGQCGLNDDGDTVCQTALMADGAACDVAGLDDATCKSSFCNEKSKCATVCTHDGPSSTYVGCPKNYYCAYPSERLRADTPASR